MRRQRCNVCMKWGKDRCTCQEKNGTSASLKTKQVMKDKPVKETSSSGKSDPMTYIATMTKPTSSEEAAIESAIVKLQLELSISRVKLQLATEEAPNIQLKVQLKERKEQNKAGLQRIAVGCMISVVDLAAAGVLKSAGVTASVPFRFIETGDEDHLSVIERGPDMVELLPRSPVMTLNTMDPVVVVAWFQNIAERVIVVKDTIWLFQAVDLVRPWPWQA
ncbi:hypothetical protein AK812_SmicGene44247 [Symbiodinium microadriaticum]|uniref:Uncharacterized protein n=1 Tax=Symbiodinium microadriaticum TaxID=2951 RepID=A0A1Q9BZ58_SYMMI|nr:hypothetical protein AK812_SmicGene44247 [Symbiodinium microadriaticum]